MATSSDPGGIGRSSLAVPDPRLNASQILAWAICWPWNLLWTVCAYNPLAWLIDIAVREFRSGLEEISSGQFREIERELMGDDNALPASVPSQVVAEGRPGLVVGDPLPGWHAKVAAPAAATLQNHQDQLAAATVAQTAVGGTVASSVSPDAIPNPRGAGEQDATGVSTRELDPWTWAPPDAARERLVSRTPGKWYSVGELKSVPEVAANPLTSAGRSEMVETRSTTSVPKPLPEAWGSLPSSGGGSTLPLN